MTSRATRRDYPQDSCLVVTPTRTPTSDPEEETACGNDHHMWLELDPEAFRLLRTDLSIRATERGIGPSSV